MYKKIFGKIWGLKPYIASSILSKVEIVLSRIKFTPSGHPDIIDILPLDIFIKNIAVKTALWLLECGELQIIITKITLQKYN